MTKLDHIVVNVLRGMDPAAELFRQLGFTLTPRGYHTLGSINHLMMTSGPYLELVGVPEKGKQRQDVLDSPIGLNGLVFKSDDVDATYEELLASGIAAPAPLSFSRPVEIVGKSFDARFRTVRLPAELTPAGRVYFCQHLTPELVWRKEWLGHPNGFCGIFDMVVVSPSPREDAVLYAGFGGKIEDDSATELLVKFESFDLRIVAGETSRFHSAGLLFNSLDEIERRAEVLPSVAWERHGAALAHLSMTDFSLTFECRSRT